MEKRLNKSKKLLTEGVSKMWELLEHIDCGSNVREVVGTQDCRILHMHDDTGDGMMTIYYVFPGVFLMYSDYHMRECISEFCTDANLLCVDHCREGRIEQEVRANAYSYLEAGDLRIDNRSRTVAACLFHFVTITACPLDLSWTRRRKESRRR